MSNVHIRLASLLICATSILCAAEQGGETNYADGRPAATLRYDALDQGIVLPFGGCPKNCDKYGARDVWVLAHKGKSYMHYDAAGEAGWLAALAVSSDLEHWTKLGTVLELGPPGSRDSASASYGTTFFDGHSWYTFYLGTRWYMFYLGTPHATPAPDRIPSFPYLTLEARSHSPSGPWTKLLDVTPFQPVPGTYYSATASPGQIIRNGAEYIQFFSASTDKPILRTLSIARTRQLTGTWTIDPSPILPPDEQVENSSLYFEKANSTWFLFTNHVGIDAEGEYTDAIWVYWTKDLNRLDPKKKAIVLDGKNSKWSKRCVGLPSVLPYKNRLAIFYDAPGGNSVSHMYRSIGLAWLELPLIPPAN
jgi:predicted GH43/DUF377 family glycosyl hydrolase